MTASTEVNGAAVQPTETNSGKPQVKILMLHGFTQSGALLRAKTRALEKLLVKTLSPLSLSPVLIYPTGPNRLLPQDMPFYAPPLNPDDDDYQPDTWAWWRKDEASGEYLHLDKGMETVAQAIREAGGIDGVCGFSQGGAATGIIAAALESERPVPEGAAGEWVRKLREANGGRAAKFAVSYSGFWATPASLQFLYEPKISTPSLHYIGSLDTVVEESRSQALIDRCESATRVVHPGGHHVPVSREWVLPLAGFIKQHVSHPVKAGL
ncbi:hypothetical protein ED733_001724 [Metarhizium rileyi]|uniref:Serine hydrolase domain-containing protein n=1 Tax=Metarhizium rileyi (strain RCEF 4871) TaxID=1649241 RepID=A0A5C6G2K7_METRR|nr:hypothetical protein ED733_001724 [Metarhizium rileyi]